MFGSTSALHFIKEIRLFSKGKRNWKKITRTLLFSFENVVQVSASQPQSAPNIQIFLRWTAVVVGVAATGFHTISMLK